MRHAFVLTLLLSASPSFAGTVSFESLLDEMVDRDRLARQPSPAYTCSQASSYDRDSVGPGKPGWFANWDRSQFVRTEEKDGHKEYVLMDEEGPGAVVRFWATWHGPRGKEFTNGTLRVYLDGDEKPAIAGPIASVIDGGGLVGPPLSQGVSPETIYGQRGHNLYLPIPYANQCKITYETAAPVDRGAKTGEALYYQINYRTYEKGTKVEPFRMAAVEKLKAKIEKIQRQLLRSGVDTPGSEKAFRGFLPAGQAHTIELSGPAAVSEIVVKLGAPDQSQALRSTVLELEFDGEVAGWCPVDAFFGGGYLPRPYRTWYTEVKPSGAMACFWVMPFEKSCKVKLTNLTRGIVNVENLIVRSTPWEWDDRSMHFRATWRQLTKVDTRGGKNMTGSGAFDVNYATVEGQGVWVGDTLTVFNGADAWWGEGDEKIFVDGEAFPSHFGTGTEDYYGYAWCKPAFFNAPFHAQPNGSGNLRAGFSINSRYRALDAIPFTKKIQFDMELWHWAGTNVNYAPASFFYARPGAAHNVKPDPKSAALPIARDRRDVVNVFIAKGAIEGESLKVKERTGGESDVQAVGQFRWSDDRQLWWRDGKVGDRLVLQFSVKDAGRYEVFANLTKAVDYGIVDIAIDDRPPKRFDRYHTAVAHDKLSLGTFDLSRGVHDLVVVIAGSNPKAIKKHMFGLDYLMLTPKS